MRRRLRAVSRRLTPNHHARYAAAIAVLAVAAASIVVGLTAGRAGAAGLVFTDGFESGNLTQWTASSGVTVQNSVKYAGTWAARATTTGTTAAYVYKNLSTPLSELWYDGRFDVISQDAATNASLVRFRTAAVGSIFSIMRRSDGKLAYFNEVTGVTTVGPAVTNGTWHELEVHVLISGTSSVVETWLDGVKIAAMSKTDSLGTTPVGRIYIGDPATGRTFDYAFDNQLVSGNLTANAGGSTFVDLAWTASTDDTAVTGYTISRNGTVLATVPSGTTYRDNTVVSGTTYTYTVDAFDAAGNHSPASNGATVTPVSDLQAPTVPTQLAAVAASPTRVDLTWHGSTDNIAVTGYTVYRNSVQLDVVSGSVTSYSDTNASPGTAYSYTVDAFDAAANHSARSSTPVSSGRA